MILLLLAGVPSCHLVSVGVVTTPTPSLVRVGGGYSLALPSF